MTQTPQRPAGTPPAAPPPGDPLTPDELEFLHSALDLAREGRTDELAALVDSGLPVDLTGTSGDSLLILAAYHVHPETVQALLDRGADTARVNDRGQTALAAAAFRRSTESVTALLRAGADPDLGPRSARQVVTFFDLADMGALLDTTVTDGSGPGSPAAATTSVQLVAERLVEAARTHVPCPPVRDLLPADDVAAAYAVQSAVLAPRLREGARTIGRKVGLTNPAVQRQLGVDQPDFGVLLDDMLCPQDSPVDHRRLLQPRIEAEVAFVLADDLDQPGELTADVVRAAVGHAVAALEIVDSRVAGWDIRIVDTVADNASSGLFVLGDQQVPLIDVEPAEVTMTMTRDGEQVSTGTGRDCLGDPLAALAWLATTCRDRGVPLRAGEVVLSGALGPMVPVLPGETFEATISGLGTVRATFSGAREQQEDS